MRRIGKRASCPRKLRIQHQAKRPFFLLVAAASAVPPEVQHKKHHPENGGNLTLPGVRLATLTFSYPGASFGFTAFRKMIANLCL